MGGNKKGGGNEKTSLGEEANKPRFGLGFEYKLGRLGVKR